MVKSNKNSVNIPSAIYKHLLYGRFSKEQVLTSFSDVLLLYLVRFDGDYW